MQISAYASIGIIGITVLVFGVIFVTNIESDIVEDVFEKEMEVENVFEKEIQPIENPEIQEKLDAIEKVAEQSEYEILPREWITSGPFQIDRSEYAVGEKIFIRIGGLEIDELGQMVVMRPLNSTHHKQYLTIPFDGSDRSAFNYYLEPQINKKRAICSVDDLAGIWVLTFRGVNYPNIEFEINKKVVPGTDVTSVC